MESNVTEAVQSPSPSASASTAQARHRLLVLVRPGQDSEPVLRMARKLALSFHAPWLALYVEPATPVPDAEQWGVSRELELARELGADVLTTAADDVLNATLRIAAQRDISQLVIGKSPNLGIFRNRDSLVSALLRQSGELAVHIVPVGNSREQPVSAIWKTRAPA